MVEIWRQASEEERKRLERQVLEQMEALKRKQQEYSRLKELRHNERKRVKDLEVEVAQMRRSPHHRIIIFNH